MSYANIISAIAKEVQEARLKVLEDVQAFVLDKVDEESAEAIKELFDDFRKEFDKTLKEETVAIKKGVKKGSGAKTGEKKTGGSGRKPTAYNMFVSENMKRFKNENPSLKGKETMKLAMEAWGALSEEQKNEYRKKMAAGAESVEESE